MDLTILIAVVGLVATISLAILAYVQWRENHSDRAGSKLEVKVKEIVLEENQKQDLVLADHTNRLGQADSRFSRIEELLRDISAQQRTMGESQTRMGVKVDMYWTSLEQMAMNSAKNLHQPDPRRQHVDRLLEAFMEGTLTPEERIELRKVLVTIRNYEPGSGVPLEFPVYPGEQTAAAILLSTMDVVDPRIMASLGHSAHRSDVHSMNDEENP